MRILIVDDAKQVAEEIKRRLEEQSDSPTVETEESFDAALDRIREFMPDLLVLDLLEGDLEVNVSSGLTKVRSQLRRFVPLVFFSALDGPPDVHPSALLKSSSPKMKKMRRII